MANLISPGVSVTVTDESFFIPASATTVPLMFVATAAEKTRPDGVTPAAGTYEYNVVRTVTSLKQSTELYGIPRFLKANDSAQYHGDARNEYGLFALNHFLGVGNLAYVIRANVNLDDDLDSLRAIWDSKVTDTSYVLENLVNQFLLEQNQSSGAVQGDPNYRETVTDVELLSLAATAGQDLWDFSSFAPVENDFTDDATLSPLPVYANGYDVASTGNYIGFEGLVADWVANASGSTPGFLTEFTADEAGTLFVGAADDFKYTSEFLTKTRLGVNDANRRTAIVSALQSVINSNTDIRGEQYEYNLILCPGYPEVVDELLALCSDIQDEAFVIADTPMNMDPSEVVAWAATSERRNSTQVAYYYPHGLASNLDGNNVCIAASGIALRTMTYSDETSEIWFAPAGTRRGLVSGVSQVGYVDGTLGSATTFVETALNQGQRNNLYTYFTNINPIVFFPGRGIIVWGQKTSTPDASALDRINVSRLIAYIKRSLRKNTMSYVFQPNDQLTRDDLKATVDSFLGDLIVKRGLYDFATICDESNNTPDRIDRNEMYIDVALKPVKAAEFIYIPIRIVATGAEI